MRQISPTDSTALRFPITGSPAAPSSTSTRRGVLIARSRSVLIPQSAIRNPKSAIESRFIVDQRVAAFRKTGPWLDLDDVMQHGAFEPERDLLDGAPQGAPLAGPRGGTRVPGEELQLVGARGEGGELDDEPLHGARGRRLRQARLERRGDVVAVRGGVLERGRGEPRGGALELGPRAHRLHAPPRAARMPQRALDQPLEREHEHLPVRHRREEGEGGADRLGERAADDRVRGRARREPPPAATGAPELRYDRLLGQRGELPQRP